MPFATLLDNKSWDRFLSLRHNKIASCGVAVGAVGAAAAVRYALSGYLTDGSAFATFYLAVLVSSIVGGFWSGLFAVILSTLTVWYLFVPPAFTFALRSQETVSLLLFVLSAGLMPVIVSLFHGALDRLLQAKERQELLTRELHHRSRNLFALIQALATRTLKESETLAQASENLNGRLMALARAHTMLAQDAWDGASLDALIRQELSGFSAQISVTGCDFAISTPAAQNFALVIHELATNAIKYGALSLPNGRVVIEGRTAADGTGQFRLRWKEMDGPAVVQPTRKGFGSTILLEVATQLGDDVNLKYQPDGLRYELQCDLGAITMAGEKKAAQVTPPTAAPLTQHL